MHVKCAILYTLRGQAKFPQFPPEYLRLYRNQVNFWRLSHRAYFSVENQQHQSTNGHEHKTHKAKNTFKAWDYDVLSGFVSITLRNIMPLMVRLYKIKTNKLYQTTHGIGNSVRTVMLLNINKTQWQQHF